ncbi:MAG: hypothetical protein IPM53_16605 [Anaerolineaceae bacterium]|nr:hypothetical protein [Anaerolineaceae bacterium]
MNTIRRLFIAAIILLCLSITTWILAEENGLPSQTVGFVTEFPISTANGAPQNVAVQTAGPPVRIWFTMPAANALGRLVVTDASNFTFNPYVLSTPNSQPYDLAYDAVNGRIWFTERARAYIGYIIIANGNIVEIPIPNGGLPHSIARAPNGLIWFTQPEANNLVRFDPNTSTFTAYAYTSANGAPTKISIANNDSVWFTAPGTNHMAEFKTATQQFVKIPVADFGSSPVPPSDVFAQGNIPWIANPTQNRIGRFLPETLAFFRWFELPAADTGINSLFLTQPSGLIRLWYTEPNNGRVGQMTLESTNLDVVGNALHGLPSSNSLPVDIVVDSTGTAWIADQGAASIVSWSAPYNIPVYLPLVQKP